MPWIADAANLSNQLKTIAKIVGTKDALMHIDVEKEKTTLSTAVNQRVVSIESSGCDDQQFQIAIPISTLTEVLSGSKLVKFSFKDNQLVFVAEKVRGKLSTTKYQPIKIVRPDTTALNKDVQDFIFKNLHYIDFQGKNLENQVLQVKFDQGRGKMMSMQYGYSGMVNIPFDAQPIEYKILLSYGSIITSLFTNTEDIKILAGANNIQVFDGQTYLSLPMVSYNNFLEIDQLENSILPMLNDQSLSGALVFSGASELKSKIDQLVKFYGDAKNQTRITISKKSDKDIIMLRVAGGKGIMESKLECEESSGEFAATFEASDLASVLDRCKGFQIKMEFFTNLVKINRRDNPGVVYLVSLQENKDGSRSS